MSVADPSPPRVVVATALVLMQDDGDASGFRVVATLALGSMYAMPHANGTVDKITNTIERGRMFMRIAVNVNVVIFRSIIAPTYLTYPVTILHIPIQLFFFDVFGGLFYIKSAVDVK